MDNVITPPDRAVDEDPGDFGDRAQAWVSDVLDRAQFISDEVRAELSLPLTDVGIVSINPDVQEMTFTQILHEDMPEDLLPGGYRSYAAVELPYMTEVTDRMLVKAIVEASAKEAALRRAAVKTMQGVRAEEFLPYAAAANTSNIASEAERVVNSVLIGFGPSVSVDKTGVAENSPGLREL